LSVTLQLDVGNSFKSNGIFPVIFLDRFVAA
jgi:hypothetical protein